jgi:hypothetical protein
MGNTFGGDDMIIETKMLEGGGGIVHGWLDIDGVREQVRLITIPMIVMQVDIVASGSNGGTISRHGSKRCVEKEMMDK